MGTEGQSLVEAYLGRLAAPELSARLLGYTPLPRPAPDGLKRMPELSLRSSKAKPAFKVAFFPSPSSLPFCLGREWGQVGASVLGIVTEVNAHLGLRLSVSPAWVGNVALLRVSPDVTVLRDLGAHFKVPFSLVPGHAGE